MCLTTNVKTKINIFLRWQMISHIKRAQKDIITYKLLTKDKTGKLHAPFRGNEMRIGRGYRSGFSFSIDNDPREKNSILVERGLHSCTSIEYLIKHIRVMIADQEKCVIVECIIPKGACYIEGREGDIVSKKLIINKIIEDGPDPEEPFQK